MGGKRREDVIDRPVSWDEVVLKAVPLQEGEEDVNEVGSSFRCYEHCDLAVHNLCYLMLTRLATKCCRAAGRRARSDPADPGPAGHLQR
jgi:hypothetical protein